MDEVVVWLHPEPALPPSACFLSCDSKGLLASHLFTPQLVMDGAFLIAAAAHQGLVLAGTAHLRKRATAALLPSAVFFSVTLTAISWRMIERRTSCSLKRATGRTSRLRKCWITTWTRSNQVHLITSHSTVAKTLHTVTWTAVESVTTFSHTIKALGAGREQVSRHLLREMQLGNPQVLLSTV